MQICMEFSDLTERKSIQLHTYYFIDQPVVGLVHIIKFIISNAILARLAVFESHIAKLQMKCETRTVPVLRIRDCIKALNLFNFLRQKAFSSSSI